MRILGLILISALPLIIGLREAQKAGAALTAAEELLIMIDEIRSFIRYQALTLDDIMEQLGCEERYRRLGFGEWSRENGEFSVRIADFLRQNERLCVSAEQKRLMTDFFTALGHSNTESQENICALYRSKLESMLAEMRNEAPKRRKLCRALGALGALFVFVILF
ncbi:MAG: stage III sporulation protein AB [Acutalibacteraceae bacterium]